MKSKNGWRPGWEMRLGLFIAGLTLALASSTSPCRAGGRTTVTYQVIGSVDVPVSMECIASEPKEGWIGSGRGRKKGTDWSDISKNCDRSGVPVVRADIVHDDPPSGLLQSCDKVIKAVIRPPDSVLSTEFSRFTLDRPLCSFSIGSNSVNWQTYPVLGPVEIWSACRASGGSMVSRQPRFALGLIYNGGRDEDLGLIGTNNTVQINLHCPKCEPLNIEPWSKNTNSSGGASGAYWESPQGYAAGGYPPINYSVSGGTLPPGMTMDPQTGKVIGKLSTGVFRFTVKATDSCPYGGQTKAVEQVIAGCAPLGIYSELPHAKGGVPYKFNVNTIKHNGTDPVSLRVAFESLPDGVRLNQSTGLISGTPPYTPVPLLTPSSGETKQYGVVVRLTDSCAGGERTLEKFLTLVVEQEIIVINPKPDLALEDLIVNDECGLVAVYSNRGKGNISATVRQQVAVNGQVVMDGPVSLDIRQGLAVTKTLLEKSAFFGAVDVKVVIDTEKKLSDPNRTNNTRTVKFSCDKRAGSASPRSKSPSAFQVPGTLPLAPRPVRPPVPSGGRPQFQPGGTAD